MRFAFLAGLFAAISMFSAACAADIDIPFEKFTLDNGLTVVVHEDRKAPVVAVGVWYHVGSKNEPAGKTGFAHLFEHLMFNGSEHYDGEWFVPLDEVGATGVNGTTSFDRTNYYQTVPTPALERILWLESDRMGHLLGAITQEKLDNQRGVVQNEKRQGDNQPYGRMFYSVLEGLFPAAHPYRHPVIGSLEDLDAASLDDVKSWFKTYYGAANTVLVLAGDIDAQTARPLVEKYFGHIAAGDPLTAMTSNAPPLPADTFEIMQDRVPQVRVDRNWVAPRRTEKDAILLMLAADVLGGGKTSRLFKNLVYDKQLATSVSASYQGLELAGFYSASLDVREGVETAEAEAEFNRVLDEFLKRGPTKAELDRSKTVLKAGTLRSLESVSGKAAALAKWELYADNPGFFRTRLDWLEAATPAEVLDAARQVMNAGFYQLTVVPFDDFKTSAPAVDRSTGMPAVASTPDLVFPTVEEATLSNGMKVVFARRDAVPVVEISVQFDAGYAADSVGDAKLGVASFTNAMLDEGAGKRSALDIAADLDGLGANMGAGSTLDTSSVSMSALKENLDASLDILAEVIREPTFAEEEIEKLRLRRLARIKKEKADPVSLALRQLPPEIYGDGHAYGVPFTGTGDAENVQAISRDDLVAFHQQWMRPDNGTIFVVGDTTLDEITPALERVFGDWRAPDAPLQQKAIARVERPAKGKVILVDKPDAPQSLILAGHAAPPTNAPNNIAISAMNDILGGEFIARVNMNLREERGWAYGAYTFLSGASGQRPWMVYAPVQTDKTAPAISELLREINEYKTIRPATDEELSLAVKNNTRSLPGAFEGASAVLSSLKSSARYERPWDYPATLKPKYEALTQDAIRSAAAEVIHPESLIWLIVGDRRKIEADLRALDLGDIEIRTIE